MTIADLVGFRKAIASEHICIKNGESRFSCLAGMPCSTCALAITCDKYDENFQYDIIAELKTLPEFSLTVNELQQLYPEYFI